MQAPWAAAPAGWRRRVVAMGFFATGLWFTDNNDTSMHCSLQYLGEGSGRSPATRFFRPRTPLRAALARVLGGALLGMAVQGVCQAQTFAPLLELARSNEPAYLGVKTNLEAAKARTGQAIGALLPQVSITASTNANHREYHTRDSPILPAEDRYNSHSAQVSVTQPLWRYASIAGWQQAAAVEAQVTHQMAAADQELVVRLATAWLDLLAARDQVLFASRQVAAAERQWEVAYRGSDMGMTSAPQAAEARARFDQARSDALAADTDAQLKRAALEQMVGPLREMSPPFLRDDVELADPGGMALERWLAAVDTGNGNIRAALEAYEAAGAEVRKQQAGHQPTLDLVGSYGKNSQAVGGFPGQSGYDIKLGNIGLQLNVPIFSGGAQSAKVDEALAQKEKARLDIETARRAAVLAAKQAWFGWQAGAARAVAGQQALRAAQAALQVARMGAERGLKTDLDVLQADQQWHGAQRDWRKGRYEQLAANLKLKAAAGVLAAEDVTALDALFVPSPPGTEPARAGTVAARGEEI